VNPLPQSVRRMFGRIVPGRDTASRRSVRESAACPASCITYVPAPESVRIGRHRQVTVPQAEWSPSEFAWPAESRRASPRSSATFQRVLITERVARIEIEPCEHDVVAFGVGGIGPQYRG